MIYSPAPRTSFCPREPDPARHLPPELLALASLAMCGHPFMCPFCKYLRLAGTQIQASFWGRRTDTTLPKGPALSHV